MGKPKGTPEGLPTEGAAGVLFAPLTGAVQAVQGAPKILQSGHRMEGLADVLEGGSKAMLPYAPAGLLKMGLGRAITSGLGAMAGSFAGSEGASLVGASPEAQRLAGDVGGLAGGGLGFKGHELLPNADRAGENFKTVHAAARDIPLDTVPARGIVDDALVRLPRQGSTPRILRQFARESDAAPMTFDAGRDYQSGAGRLSVSDYMQSNPASRRAVAQFADAMGTANQQAADQAGVGSLYKGALREYQNASRVKNAVKTATGGGVLAYGARKAKQMGVKLP